jgi:site-specific DNA-adenine methylase
VLKAPFPWFGGKSRVAHLVWDRFGDVANYVEPFFGSGAVLLCRPTSPGIETVNDLDCMVANFWRALQHDPEAVAEFRAEAA